MPNNQKNQKTPSTRRRNRSRRRRKQTTVSNPKLNPMAALSDCGRDYIRALANPFTGPLACVPSFPALKTLKARSWVRGTFTAATTGDTMFVVMDPGRMCVNNGTPIYYSNGNFVGTDISTTASASVGSAQANGPYDVADWANTETGFGARIVAAGLRIRYCGVELYKQGRIFALHDPTHTSLNGRSVTEMGADVQTMVFPVSSRSEDGWTTLLYKPALVADTQFSQGPPGLASSYYMGFMVAVAPVNSVGVFEFEAYAVTEFNGVNVRGQTPSHTDPIGFSAAHSVSSFTGALNASQLSSANREKNALATALDYISHGISGATRVVTDTYSSSMRLATAVEPLMSLL